MQRIVFLLLLLNYSICGALNMNLFGKCLTFYGTHNKSQFEFIRLELESNEVLMKAYRAGDPQAKMEVDLIKRMNLSDLYIENKWIQELDRQTEELRKLNPGKTYLTPVLIYHKQKQDYVAVRAGETPPKGYTLFLGTFSNPVYYGAIAKGMYPIGDLGSLVKFFGLYIPERTLQHGLSHIGGFWAHPEYAQLMIELGKFYMDHIEDATNTVLYKKIGIFSESLWLPDTTQKEKLVRLSGVLKNTLGLKDTKPSVPHYQEQLLKIDFSTLKKAAQYMLELTPEITPISGGSATMQRSRHS